MADMTTTLQNIVAMGTEFTAMVYQKLVEKSSLRAAGVIVDDAEVADRASSKSLLTSIPFWNPLAQTESKVPSDNKATIGETGNITQGELQAYTNIRVNGWSVMGLSSLLSFEDPIDAIANRMAEYWTIEEKRMAIAILKGLLAADEATTDEMYVGDGTAALSTTLLARAAETLGDNYETVNTLVIPKSVHTYLQIAEGNAFVPKSKTDINFDTYNGFKLVVDSTMPVTSGVATCALISTAFFKAGETSYGDDALEVERNARAGNLGGETTLINRRKFGLVAAGVNQTGIVTAGTPPVKFAGKAPTNAELAAALMWSKGFDRDNIPVAFMKVLATA